MLTLDGSGALRDQLYRALRAAILSGRLPSGARLPSSRGLASEAGVSRNTVLQAFDQLLAEGYVVGRHGSGTYVARELPPDMRLVSARAIAPPPAVAPRWSAYGRRLAERVGPLLRPRPQDVQRLAIDFRYGLPDVMEFPHETWRRVLLRCARKASAQRFDYGPPEGSVRLRAALADYLQRSRGVVCTAEQIVVVNGSQQGLDLIARALLDPRDAAVVEEPHYDGVRNAILAAGARLIALPVDAEGLDIGTLRSTAKVRIACATPSHQYPLGGIMPLARRLALLAWAQRTGAYVVEDDYDSEYRYAGRPVEALQGLARAGRVIYLGTLSKVMFPALRLGYLVLPEPLLPVFRTAKSLADGGSATLEQEALAEFIVQGHFERHLRRSRARHGRRRAALLSAIADHLGDRVEVFGANAGVHLGLWLRDVRPTGVRDLIRRARAAGLGIYSIAPYYLTPPPRAGLLIGYASLTEARIREGIRQLAGLLV